MKRVNFREWLEWRGFLDGYLRNRLESMERNGWPYEVLMEDPYEWINHAFKWERTPENHDYWEEASESWDAELLGLPVSSDGDGRVDFGMPMNDKLGMTLLLAELEENNGHD